MKKERVCQIKKKSFKIKILIIPYYELNQNQLTSLVQRKLLKVSIKFS